MLRPFLAIVLLASFPSLASAGLYYSGEKLAELPSRWNGFLIDLRSLRSLSMVRTDALPPSPLRVTYREAITRLESARKKRQLTADELADLGALTIRLGDPGKAIEILRLAARSHPNHFRIAANLGTAWQLAGDLEQSIAALQESVKLAPVADILFEKYHLKLVELRLKEGRAVQRPMAPDDLLGVKYSDESIERKKLPENAIAIVQLLLLSLPADGRLLWQLGELANATGDVREAAAILDGCVSEFAMSAPLLRTHRQIYRTAADGLAKGHEVHAQRLAAKSMRPLLRRFDVSMLPPIDPAKPNLVPWGLIADTTFDSKTGPAFPKHLERLDGLTVLLTGFMQPIGENDAISSFLLIEYPVGCWFCETPGPTSVVNVELANGSKVKKKRELIKVIGVLSLNRDNPEYFLFRIKDARIREPE